MSNVKHYILREAESRKRIQRRMSLVLKAYTLLGLLLATLSGAYFLISLLNVDLSSNQKTALIMAGVGISLAFLSRVLIMIQTERLEQSLEFAKEQATYAAFLHKWNQFEKTGEEALAKYKGNLNKYSPKIIISLLQHDNLINNEDVKSLKESLRMRNLIAHGEAFLHAELINEKNNALSEIINKIHHQHKKQ